MSTDNKKNYTKRKTFLLRPSLPQLLLPKKAPMLLFIYEMIYTSAFILSIGWFAFARLRPSSRVGDYDARCKPVATNPKVFHFFCLFCLFCRSKIWSIVWTQPTQRLFWAQIGAARYAMPQTPLTCVNKAQFLSVMHNFVFNCRLTPLNASKHTVFYF
jgi:hypothetical protein